MSKEEVYPGDFDVESYGVLEEVQVVDSQQGRSPFDDTKVQFVNTDNDPVIEDDIMPAIAVTLPPRRLKTVVVGSMVTAASTIILLAENLKKQRTIIQVVTDSVTVYISEQSNANVSSGYPLDSTMQPLELWGCNALYAIGSGDAEVRCLIEYEV